MISLLLFCLNVFIALVIADLVLKLLISFEFVKIEGIVIPMYRFFDKIFFNIYYEMRKFVPFVGGIDLSPLVLMVILMMIRSILD